MHTSLGVERQRKVQRQGEDISPKPAVSRCLGRSKGLLGAYNRVLRESFMEHKQAGEGIQLQIQHKDLTEKLEPPVKDDSEDSFYNM